jgi:tetraacyldisaccharide 4'-kinase
MDGGESLKEVLSGKGLGPAGLLVYPVLLLLSFLYGAVMSARNLLYDIGLIGARKTGVPVVSVGNITVGGTGKTPLVAYLAREARARGYRPAVVARGYRGVLRDGELINDEGLLLEEALPGLIVVQDPDRCVAAKKAVAGRGADFVILDDAFQHRRIARDINIVTLDGRAPFGNGRVLPAGLLRERPGGVRRADLLVLTRCLGLSGSVLGKTREKLRSLAAGTPLFLTDHEPESVRPLDGGDALPLEALDGMEVFLFSGIADPGAFSRTVIRLGARVKGSLSFPDHHCYDKGDVERIRGAAAAAGTERVLTTAKDAVKLRGIDGARSFFVLHVAIRFLGGDDEFKGLVFGDGGGDGGGAGDNAADGAGVIPGVIPENGGNSC